MSISPLQVYKCLVSALAVAVKHKEILAAKSWLYLLEGMNWQAELWNTVRWLNHDPHPILSLPQSAQKSRPQGTAAAALVWTSFSRQVIYSPIRAAAGKLKGSTSPKWPLLTSLQFWRASSHAFSCNSSRAEQVLAALFEMEKNDSYMLFRQAKLGQRPFLTI